MRTRNRQICYRTSQSLCVQERTVTSAGSRVRFFCYEVSKEGESFEEASRVLQGRSENTDSPGVSQTRLRTVRTEVWPSHCSTGRICKARMEGLPGFRSLSTAPCPPPASRFGRPSYPTLGRPLLSLCWLRSPSHVDTQEPPERPPGFRSCGPGGQVSLLLQTLSNPEKYHKSFPGSKCSAGRTPCPLLPTAACQPRGSFFLASKHSELIPERGSARLLPCPASSPSSSSCFSPFASQLEGQDHPILLFAFERACPPPVLKAVPGTRWTLVRGTLVSDLS